MRRLTAILIGSALLLGGCAERSMQDLQRFTETAYQDRKPEIEPLPEITPHETFIYTASSLVDPFSSANLGERETASSEGLAPDRDRRKEPLETYPLDSLRMVGTLMRPETSWVVLRAPDGTIHEAQVGNYVGQNYGVITNISEEKVALTELVQDPNGKWIERDAILSIAQR